MTVLDTKLAERKLGDAKVRAFLDDLSIEAVQRTLGEPRRAVIYAQPPTVVRRVDSETITVGWKPGDGRPLYADEDPAIMQAIARCAANRVRNRDGVVELGGIHPEPCGWCDAPLDLLLAASAWDVWRAHYVIADVFTWRGGNEGQVDRPVYERAGPWSGTYQSPDHQAFWDLPPADRGSRVDAAIRASRA